MELERIQTLGGDSAMTRLLGPGPLYVVSTYVLTYVRTVLYLQWIAQCSAYYHFVHIVSFDFFFVSCFSVRNFYFILFHLISFVSYSSNSILFQLIRWNLISIYFIALIVSWTRGQKRNWFIRESIWSDEWSLWRLYSTSV